ncbi:hypothetical protein [Ehrlichia muris]|uniref:Uncharacterized protein n=1 Tax=Ehrlichia muris AS145 TaxID=1423892 RepID=V9R7F9_9RICK|nr:hypothetical protein [Ehrlichia muris]AHC39752.1 hypothetical protein EMUR_03870 [Ehrlichia muris AS145]
MRPSDLFVINSSLVQRIKHPQFSFSSMNHEESIKVKLFKFITPRNAMICFRFGLFNVVSVPVMLGFFPYYMYTKLYSENNPDYNGTSRIEYPIIIISITLLLVVFSLLFGVACVVVSIPMLLVSLLLLPFRKCCLPTVNQHHSEGNPHYKQTSTSDEDYDDSSSSEYSYSTAATECSLVLSEKTNMLHID